MVNCHSSIDFPVESLSWLLVTYFIIDFSPNKNKFCFSGLWLIALASIKFLASPLAFSLLSLLQIRKTEWNLNIADVTIFCHRFYLWNFNCVGLTVKSDFFVLSEDWDKIEIVNKMFSIVQILIKWHGMKRDNIFCCCWASQIA